MSDRPSTLPLLAVHQSVLRVLTALVPPALARMASQQQPAFNRLDIYHLAKAATAFSDQALRSDDRFRRLTGIALGDRARQSATLEHLHWGFEPLDLAASWVDVLDEASFRGVAPSAELERVVGRRTNAKREQQIPARRRSPPGRQSPLAPSVQPSPRPMTPSHLHRNSLPVSPRAVGQTASPTSPMSLSPSSLFEHEVVEWLDPFTRPLLPNVNRSPALSIRRRMTDASAPPDVSRPPDVIRGGGRRSTLSAATPVGAAAVHLPHSSAGP